MKHDEMLPEQICRIYGHNDMRWLPLVGPPHPPQESSQHPRVLLCHICDQIVERST